MLSAPIRLPCQAYYLSGQYKDNSQKAKTLLRDQQPMAGINQSQSSQTLRHIVERILNSGQVSRIEHLQLVTTFLSDYKVTDDERSQINHIFDDVQTGHLKIVD